MKRIQRGSENQRRVDLWQRDVAQIEPCTPHSRCPADFQQGKGSVGKTPPVCCFLLPASVPLSQLALLTVTLTPPLAVVSHSSSLTTPWAPCCFTAAP